MDNSPLTRLPAELRNQIYEYVVTLPYKVWTTIYDEREDGVQDTSFSINVLQSFRNTLAISSVCLQIREESQYLTWACNSFFLDHALYCCPGEPEHHRKLIRAFLDAIGPQTAHALRDVCVEVAVCRLWGLEDSEELSELLKQGLVGMREETHGLPNCRVTMQQRFCYAFDSEAFDSTDVTFTFDLGDVAASFTEAAVVMDSLTSTVEGMAGLEQIALASSAFRQVAAFAKG